MLRSTVKENQPLLIAASIGLLSGIGLGVMMAVRGTHKKDTPQLTKALQEHFDGVQESDRAARKHKSPPIDPSTLTFRPPTSEDIPLLGQQWHDSYNSSAHVLGQPSLFPTVESATAMVKAYVETKTGLVAVDAQGKVLASAFNDESDVATSGNVSCGPWTTEYALLNNGVGHALMSALLTQSISRGAKTLRLLQGPTNHSSYALYARLGFEIKENLTYFTGRPEEDVIETVVSRHTSWTLQEWTEQDVKELDELWTKGTGYSRVGTLTSIATSVRRVPRFLLRSSSVTGSRLLAFTTGFGGMGSSAAVSEAAFQHLVCAAAKAQPGVSLSMQVPIRIYPELNRWMLNTAGMRVGRTAHLMVCGEWKPIGREEFFYAPSTELS